MSTPENTFIGSVHKHLPVEVYRMKNHNQYIGGIADCWYSGAVADLWVEYKFITVPQRGTTMIDLITGKSPEITYLQQSWLRSRHAEGRNVGVIVGSKQGGVWFPGTTWDCAYSTDSFVDRCLSRLELSQLVHKLTA